MTPALRTHALSKQWGAFKANSDVTLSFTPGARHALIGPNGAGKTTFINLLTGIFPPSAGQIFLEGEDITRLAAEGREQRGRARTFQINQRFRAITPHGTMALPVSERMGGGHDRGQVIG